MYQSDIINIINKIYFKIIIFNYITIEFLILKMDLKRITKIFFVYIFTPIINSHVIC